MLQFWKKPSHKEDPVSPLKCKQEDTSLIEEKNVKKCPLVSLDDEGLSDIGDNEYTKEHSRLSKTLREVLSDKSALEYFIQYLKSRNASSYIKCWLEIDNFQCHVRQSLEEKKQQVANSPSPSHKTDHDSLSVSTDCDSYTADSSSLCEFSECRTDVSVFESASRSRQQNVVDYALSIFKKYIAIEAKESIRCPEDVRKEVIESICSRDHISACCFEKVQKHVFDVMEKEYFQAFLNSDFFCKYQIDVLTSGNVVLEDILYNETALFYFMEFIEQENQRNLLEFWLAATNFQQQLKDQKDFLDPNEAQNDAVVLYDKYFSLQALCPLGFGDKVRFAVEQNICGENGIMLDCFHLPLKIVEQVLERNYLRPFLASQLFYKYLSELIGSVQQANGPPPMGSYERDKSSPSDCGSERSFGVNSTFLAMENPNRTGKARGTTDMSIDTRQLYDPDSLWKRRKSHKLTFGRVTELGRFETDFEPEPDKKSRSVLTSMVRKFVNIEEDKRKEELAWQVAEMIVKDITSVTMNQNCNHS